jgi:hypothetical protein
MPCMVVCISLRDVLNPCESKPSTGVLTSQMLLGPYLLGLYVVSYRNRGESLVGNDNGEVGRVYFTSEHKQSWSFIHKWLVAGHAL